MQIGTNRVVHALLTASILIAPNLQAQEGSAVVEHFAEIKKEFEAASSKWMASYRAASKGGASQEELLKLRGQRPNPKEFLGRVRRVVTADATSDDAAAASAWMITRGRASGADLGLALDVLSEHHMGTAHAVSVMSMLSRHPGSAVTRFLAKAVAAAAGEDLALALMTSAEQLKRAAGMARTLAAGTEDDLTRYAGSYGRDAVEALKNADADALERRSVELFERIRGDQELSAVEYRRRKMGDAAESALFELRNLSVGKVAPDIVGEDLDGTPMKLSDYRGKVVVIDFWGDW